MDGWFRLQLKVCIEKKKIPELFTLYNTSGQLKMISVAWDTSDNYNNSATDQYYQKESQHGINIQMPSADTTSPDKSPPDPSFLINGNEFLVGKGSRPPSAVKRKNTPGSRPASGKMVMAPVNASSISAYIQLKRAGKLGLNETSPPSLKLKGGHSGKSVDSDYKKKEMYSCNNCDKMYSKLRDLEIHKSYCTG
ncbi:hypothetical protein KUTeg_009789 [Tegillarca granosa]|uniref:C2H2-type domain-containing protein n=1 Tax=Tegillarca granosa TaxID=220873 RepID=A0ABQ9F867_TEGGR|nr:hypothetical protein KUTeg_009789 [Tegillarca granosa]